MFKAPVFPFISHSLFFKEARKKNYPHGGKLRREENLAENKNIIYLPASYLKSINFFRGKNQRNETKQKLTIPPFFHFSVLVFVALLYRKEEDIL